MKDCIEIPRLRGYGFIKPKMIIGQLVFMPKAQSMIDELLESLPKRKTKKGKNP